MESLLQSMRARWKLVLGIAVAGLLCAALLMTAGAAGLAWTNTEEFCIGCHEMKSTVYAEYTGTIHDRNRTGVRAICSDCHVPRQPGPMLVRKVQATMELYGHFISKSISTPEKFEAKRHELATRVWSRMKATDSLECRNCHNAEKMRHDLQSARAQARHVRAVSEKLTCIDCHFGIAHKEPEGPGPREMKVGKAPSGPPAAVPQTHLLAQGVRP